MAYGLAPARANGILDLEFATVYVRLLVGDPGVTGLLNGAAGDTTRMQVLLGAAVGGVKSATNQPVWTNGGASETITGVALFDAAVGGNFLMSGLLTVARPWVAANTFTLSTLSIALTPLAA